MVKAVYKDEDENGDLVINKKELFLLLENLEKYTSVLLKKLAKDMPTTFGMGSLYSEYAVGPFADEIKLSGLTEILWRSLNSGADKVDAVHDEMFVAEQIEYFKDYFASAESIAGDISNRENDNIRFERSDPMQLFVKLGKPAQLKIIEGGLLKIAISNHEQSIQILYKRWQVEIIEQQKWSEKNVIPLQLKKKIRAKDNEQCVYCDRPYHYHSFSYLKTNDEKPEVDNVLLVCNGCLSKKKKLKISKPAFGRFLIISDT